MWRAMLRPFELTIFWVLSSELNFLDPRVIPNILCLLWYDNLSRVFLWNSKQVNVHLGSKRHCSIYLHRALGLFVLWPIESFYVFNPSPWENGLPNFLHHNLLQSQHTKLSSMTDHVSDFFNPQTLLMCRNHIRSSKMTGGAPEVRSKFV